MCYIFATSDSQLPYCTYCLDSAYSSAQTVSDERHAALWNFGCGSFLAICCIKKHFNQLFVLVHTSNLMYMFIVVFLCECSSEVLCASVLVKSGLENRDYGRRGSAALTMRHPSIRKS
jgi:hypothetical protein